jgi:hypothetical protein
LFRESIVFDFHDAPPRFYLVMATMIGDRF